MNLERYHRIHQVLKARQTDLTLCLEEVHKPNNVSAVIRTADATGLHKVHAIWPDKMRTLTHTSAGARNWVEVETHNSIETAITELKAQGMRMNKPRIRPCHSRHKSRVRRPRRGLPP